MEVLEKNKQERYEYIKTYLTNMKPFTEDYIPSVPKMESEEDYKEYVVKNYIRCGAIPKKDLIVGKTYIGDCRNASEATWNGKAFIYSRNKFGFVYDEKINHFEDDNGYDLFVLLKLKDNE
jgi:hypothetical protein